MIKLNDFRGIYRFFFLVKIVVGWSKNLCNLNIAVGFNFFANLTVRSSLNCWEQSITVGSSQDFKSDHLNISPIYPDISPIYHRYILDISLYIVDISSIYPDISPIFYRKIKLTRACATDSIFP